MDLRIQQPLEGIEHTNAGRCNIIAGEAITLNPDRLELLGLSADLNFTLRRDDFSRDPLALVTRDVDPKWSALVQSVVKILLAAESINATQTNVKDVVTSSYPDMGATLSERTVAVVTAVGKVTELYEHAAAGAILEAEPT